jgi:hypothetical protein
MDVPGLMEETGASSVPELSVLEEKIRVLAAPLQVEHYETRIIKLGFEH